MSLTHGNSDRPALAGDESTNGGDFTVANLKASTFGSVGIDKLTESPFASVIMNGSR